MEAKREVNSLRSWELKWATALATKARIVRFYFPFYFLLLLPFLLPLIPSTALAQAHRVNQDGSNATLYDDGNTYLVEPEYGSYTDGAGNRTTWGRDTTKHQRKKNIPIGQFQWVLEPRLGTVIDAENNDTVVHNFQKWNATDGYYGEYNFLANIGSPRLSRIYFDRDNTSDEFLFLQPFSFFRGSLQDFRFTNTKSPITNLAYHSCGNKQTGEDRVRGYFATNINKLAGLGFKIDYTYGVGYRPSQPNSMFGSTFYGYYRGERYNIHAYAGVNHMKMGENGGIEDDRYIEDPISMGQDDSEIVPTMLDQTWNRNHEQHFYLAQRYNIGFSRTIEVPDSLKPTPPSASFLLSELPDSVQTALREDSVARRLMLDSLLQVWKDEQEIPKEFVPVTSIIHTFELSNLRHEYVSHDTRKDYYTYNYYGDGKHMADISKALSVRNTFGIALREGFNKWAQMGITLFGTHKLRSYQLMDGQGGLGMVRYTENDFSVGGELVRTQGSRFHYNASGEVWLIGEHVGDLNIDGKTDLQLRLGRDSLMADLHVGFMHRKPSFFYRHYHSQTAWWDNNDLNREVRLKIDGTLRLKKFGTKLQVGFENVSNYTYFGMQNTLLEGKDASSILPTDFSHAVSVMQAGSVQVFGATLTQDLKLGILHWDNQVSYQTSSNQDVLPLPTVNIYTNLYLLFRIAKVLRVQIGGDMRYFTSYYAPDYSTAIQQFAVQDTRYERIKIGSYPIVGAYANMHLKHCRFYVSVRHVNASTGHAFLVPHYPINPMTINLGLSWNFFN